MGMGRRSPSQGQHYALADLGLCAGLGLSGRTVAASRRLERVSLPPARSCSEVQMSNAHSG